MSNAAVTWTVSIRAPRVSVRLRCCIIADSRLDTAGCRLEVTLTLANRVEHFLVDRVVMNRLGLG